MKIKHEITVTISGAAGSGKSYVASKIIESLKTAGFAVETVDPICDRINLDPEKFEEIAKRIGVSIKEVQKRRKSISLAAN